MRKFILPLLSVAFVIACNNPEKQKATNAPGENATSNTDLLQLNLKGKVKSFDEMSTTIDSSGASKKDSTSYWNDFDENGYQLNFITRGIDEKTKSKEAYTRYKDGHIKEFLITNGQGKQDGKWEISVDSSGKYNTAKVYDSTGKVTGIWREISENEHAQVTGATQYKEDGKLMTSFGNKFQDANYIGGWRKDSTGKETGTTSVKLNDKGNPEEETVTTVTKDSTKTVVTTYKYDSFDEKGNWTQRTSYEKGKPVKVIKRSFEYYKD
jgi:hypothetical protein